MNKIDELLGSKKKIVSVYLTAGYPNLEDTLPLCETLQEAGVDMIEIGFPFSDPVADGPVIQESSSRSLQNGMSLKVLFEQLRRARPAVRVPLLLMGYLNPVLQYGFERFCRDCEACGIDGVILPDLPLEEYVGSYRTLFDKHNLHFILLVSPSSSDERIRRIDSESSAFIYAVSSAAVTGGTVRVDEERERWLKRLEDLRLDHPLVVGFGISDQKGIAWAHRHARGAIVGSAFIKALEGGEDAARDIALSLVSR